jgi:hypothetical protein
MNLLRQRHISFFNCKNVSSPPRNRLLGARNKNKNNKNYQSLILFCFQTQIDIKIKIVFYLCIILLLVAKFITKRKRTVNDEKDMLILTRGWTKYSSPSQKETKTKKRKKMS